MKLKNLLLASAVAICGMAGVLAIPAQNALAIKCPSGSKAGGGTEKATYAECNVRTGGDDDAGAVMDRVNTAINVILGILGVVAVAMIIMGGIQYATSQGDAAKATKARNTILYSIIGLVIALLAFAIVNFVLTNVF